VSKLCLVAGIAEDAEFVSAYLYKPVGGANVEAAGKGGQSEEVVVMVDLAVVEDCHMLGEALLHILCSVKLLPLFDALACEDLVQLLLLEVGAPTVHLHVALAVVAYQFHYQVLAYLCEGQCHEHLSLEGGQTGDKWETVEVIERGGQHNIHFADVDYVEVPQLKLSCRLLYKVLPLYLLIQFLPLLLSA
jgi:hypothetical protein